MDKLPFFDHILFKKSFKEISDILDGKDSLRLYLLWINLHLKPKLLSLLFSVSKSHVHTVINKMVEDCYCFAILQDESPNKVPTSKIRKKYSARIEHPLTKEKVGVPYIMDGTEQQFKKQVSSEKALNSYSGKKKKTYLNKINCN